MPFIHWKSASQLSRRSQLSSTKGKYNSITDRTLGSRGERKQVSNVPIMKRRKRRGGKEVISGLSRSV